VATRTKKSKNPESTGANIGYEAQLWQMADALRGSMDAAEYKHVVLGLIFLKYISDAFEEQHAKLIAEQASGADPEDPDTHRELTGEDIARIASTYHAWRGEKEAGDYADVPGFCRSALLEEVRKHGHVLTPGRYVGAEAQEDDGEPFDEKMKRLTATLREQQAEAAKLDAAIAANLKELGYGG